MKRIVERELDSWKKEKDRKVLLVRGARQVGKTYSLRKLGGQFRHFLEVNFEREPPVHAFFEGSLRPAAINEKLATYFNVPIISGETLLFFDEIQACPNAIRALRFYHEEMPELHVVAAGSLLEFALSEIPSFGVGRISSIFMYPMTFSEFLEAEGNEVLRSLTTKADGQSPIDSVFHGQLLERFRIYQVLGGLPAVVQSYIDGRDLRRCQQVIDELLTTFRDDFAKYKGKVSVARLDEVFESIVRQAGGKFKYSKVSEGAPAGGCKESLDLLVRAGLAYKIYHTSAQGIPLGAQTDLKKFKVILFDIGIHQRLLGLDLSEHIVRDPVQMINKGNLAEVFVGLELIAHASSRIHPQLYYWHRESKSSNAEVDYIVQKGEAIIPIEVKAGIKGQMQSLFIFLKERNSPFGIRISHENFGTYGKVRILPIYAVEKLHESRR